MRSRFLTLHLFATVLLYYGCSQTADQSSESQQPAELSQPQPLVEEVLSAEQQAALTPDDVVNLLKEGNQRFMNNDLTMRDHSAQVRQTTLAQFPKAIILSCVDSRVPVEDVFDRGIGDIFVARVAGNFVNEDILGSMEFACKVSGAKLILVMGHEHCGAVMAAVDDVKLGNITPMLEKIKPAVEASADYEGDKSATNEEFVHMVCENNVRLTMQQIRERSPILKEMEELGEIKIEGAIYDMDNGRVTFMEASPTALAE
ncbi:MAG: carbonic anhydrase family protein [Cyclobacteriaceae bacterium]